MVVVIVVAVWCRRTRELATIALCEVFQKMEAIDVLQRDGTLGMREWLCLCGCVPSLIILFPCSLTPSGPNFCVGNQRFPISA